MVGRTPEFLGKKIEAREVKLTVFGTIGVPLLVLCTSALAIATAAGKASIFDSGPQGWSETLYAYTSQANNNGSAFAGYSAVTFAELLGGVTMIAGRFLPLLAGLAVAGSLVGKRVTPAGAGTFRTDSPTFVVVLVGVVVLLALLTFVPALLLGPVVQGMTHRLY
jgi:potassium-transporting ATPase potassium-binding subunit